LETVSSSIWRRGTPMNEPRRQGVVRICDFSLVVAVHDLAEGGGALLRTHQLRAAEDLA